MASKMPSKTASKYFMVVAIDFGTTFSGYAFQHTSDYNKDDPTKSIYCPQAWNCGKKQLLSMKTPTCLLLDRNQDIDSFGYEAEEKYANLCLDGDNQSWYYFRRFKMQLMDTKVLFFCQIPTTIYNYSRKPSMHEPPHDKTNKMTVRSAKIQISLGIRPV